MYNLSFSSKSLLGLATRPVATEITKENAIEAHGQAFERASNVVFYGESFSVERLQEIRGWMTLLGAFTLAAGTFRTCFVCATGIDGLDQAETVHAHILESIDEWIKRKQGGSGDADLDC